MNYSEMNPIYELAQDSSYHGGYQLNEPSIPENKYLGGTPDYISRFENNVVPFGLFYAKKNEETNSSQSVYGGLVNDEMFDKLFLSVGKIEKKTNKAYSNSKTLKNPKNK